jgi:hypothetical protein
MSVDELVESVGLSNWKGVNKAAAILGRDKSTIADYVMSGILPVRRRYGVTLHHLPTILNFSKPIQGKRFEGGPALSEEGIQAYKEFREQLDDKSKDIIFVVVPRSQGAIAMAIDVEGDSCQESKNLVLQASDKGGE